MSDAVDLSVAKIDFRALSGKKVYLDTTYIRHIKGVGFVNSDYIISSLRQQMVAAHCLLQDKKEEADYIAEARVGVLGTDGHDVSFGLPASTALSTAATLMPNAPPIPTIPEISLGRRSEQQGAAKISVFAYHRVTRQPLWQSGISQSRSTAKDTYIFGAGPFQSGTIYDGTQFAGTKVKIPLVNRKEEKQQQRPVVAYDREYNFHQFSTPEIDSAVRTVDYEEEINEDDSEKKTASKSKNNK